MVHASELPPLHTQWQPRQMTPAEVLRLSHALEVPGADLDHPVVQALQSVVVGTLGHVAINEARKTRVLFLKDELHSQEWHGPTRYVWGWWCAAAKWPEVIAQGWRDSYRVTVDLAPMERQWHLHALPALGRLLAQCEMVNGFLIGSDTLEVEGVELFSAMSLTNSLVELIRDRRNLNYQTMTR